MKGVQGRWKNIALTVYLICPLALVTLLCVWIWVALEQRVENAGRMRDSVERQGAVPEETVAEPPSGEVNEAVIPEAAGNKEVGSSEPGG